MTDTLFLNWFDRTVGDWSSERRYIFNMKTMKPTNLTTKFSIEHGSEPSQYLVNWTGQTSGTMDLTVDNGVLKRSRDYFGEGRHDSCLSLIDPDTIVLHTQYDGLIFREEIRLLFNDTVRLRQTIGTCETTGEVRIVGQYYETRI